MKHSILQVKQRDIIGNPVRKLRKNSILPGIIYGEKSTPRNVQVEYNVFLKAYQQNTKTKVIEVKIEQEPSIPCLIHDLQVDPVKGNLIHFDLLVVNLSHKVHSEVPIKIIGQAKGVKLNNLVLEEILDKISVYALPDKIPNQIEVDVTELTETGDAIRLSDLPVSPDYQFDTEAEAVIVVLSHQSIDKQAEEQPIAQEQAETTEQAKKENKK